MRNANDYQVKGHHIHFTCSKCKCPFIVPTHSTKEAAA
jgi:hypothetical protein